jgi:TorA maturation chaperone TorD
MEDRPRPACPPALRVTRSYTAEAFRALGVLAEPPEAAHAAIAAALGLPGVPSPSDYTDLFVTHLYPYASVYVGADGMLGGDARDRIAGFWRALHLAPPAEPDHLAALFGLYATLRDREEDEEVPARRLSCRLARSALLWEHLLSWLPPYLDRLETIAPAVYRAWGALVRETLAAEAADAAAGPWGRPRSGWSGTLPLHLRAAPPLPDPRRDGAQTFIDGLLAPVRCGLILTRADLARAARDLGLGLRIGERRFVLAALLSQAPDAVLAWLAGEAEACAAAHAGHRPLTGAVAEFWTARAASTAALLTALREPAIGAAGAG